MLLETIIDNLRDGYNRLELGTFLHADQLTAEQVKDPSLRNGTFYVADGPLYSLEGEEKTPTLWLTRGPNNLVLRHLNDEVGSSYDQLLDDKNTNFRPDLKEARKAMEAKDTLRVDLTKLHLQGGKTEWQYLEISITGYRALNAEERKLAERWYGQGEAFATVINILNEAGIGSTRIHLLRPAYVTKEAEKNPIGRVAWLDDFYYNSSFNADFRLIYNHLALRGVRRVSREAAAPGNPNVPNAPQVNNSSP